MADNKTVTEDVNFEDAFNASCKNFKENSIIKANVVDISNELVFLNFGYKSEAKVPLTEFEVLPKIGDVIELYLIWLEGKNGDPVVSKKKADYYKDKDELKKLLNSNQLVTGFVREVQKGGFIVEYKNVYGFIPFPLFDINRIQNPEMYLNKEIKFYIERIETKPQDQNQSKNNKSGRPPKKIEEFVGNRRQFILDEGNVLKKKFFEDKKVGDVINGEVKSITDFGAFIDIGGLDALLPLKEISWARDIKVKDALKLGDKITVKILSIDEKTKKVNVGLKQLLDDPWDKFFETHKEDDITIGTVVSIVAYGAFVKIIDGVEGLLHISDMSWVKNIKNPSDLLKIGQKVELKIIKIDKTNKKISLSLKHLLENPWDTAGEKYKIGTNVKGKVKSITSFGVFLELEEGIEALLHADDLSWTEAVTKIHERFKVGEEVEAIIISNEPQKAKIKVGIKQLSDDPWKMIRENYKAGDEISCTIEKIEFEQGLSVKVTEKVTSFIPLMHIAVGSKDELKSMLKSNFKIGDEVKALVTMLDNNNRVINLSIKEYYKKKEKEKVQNFLHDEDGDSKYTLGDMIKNKAKNE